jgi:hypothetical protein
MAGGVGAVPDGGSIARAEVDAESGGSLTSITGGCTTADAGLGLLASAESAANTGKNIPAGVLADAVIGEK